MVNGSNSRMTRAVEITGYICSAMRSPLCKLEQSYRELIDEQGDKWRWFTNKKIPSGNFTISAIWRDGVVAYVRFI